MDVVAEFTDSPIADSLSSSTWSYDGSQNNAPGLRNTEPTCAQCVAGRIPAGVSAGALSGRDDPAGPAAGGDGELVAEAVVAGVFSRASSPMVYVV